MSEQYPESEKYNRVADDWHTAYDVIQTSCADGKMALVGVNSIAGVLDSYFGVDREKLETERRAMVSAQREANERAQAGPGAIL